MGEEGRRERGRGEGNIMNASNGGKVGVKEVTRRRILDLEKGREVEKIGQV
jgi:hypothetical protein